MTTHALYRFFDEAGDLLYVGITLNPAARWKQHSQDKPWWTEVANITVEPHKNRREVLEAELLAIKTEHPRHNLAHNSPPIASVEPAKLTWKCSRCGSGIRDRSGWLWVNIDAALAVLVEEKAWANRWEHRDEDGWPRPMPAAALDSFPMDVPWISTHEYCMTEADNECHGYFIDIHRVRSHGDLIAWTAHLSEKSWLGQTNWMHLMHRIVGALPA